MKEKLLAALKQAYPWVDAKILERITDKKASTLEKEEDITTVVTGVSKEVAEAYADQRVNQATLTAKEKAIKEYEETHGIKDGKVIEEGGKTNPKEKDEKPLWAIDWEKKLEELVKENETLKLKNINTERGVLISTTAKKLGIKDTFMKLVHFPETATNEEIVSELTKYQQDLITDGLMSKTDAEIQSSQKEAEEATAKNLVDEITVSSNQKT